MHDRELVRPDVPRRLVWLEPRDSTTESILVCQYMQEMLDEDPALLYDAMMATCMEPRSFKIRGGRADGP